MCPKVLLTAFLMRLRGFSAISGANLLESKIPQGPERDFLSFATADFGCFCTIITCAVSRLRFYSKFATAIEYLLSELLSSP